MDFKNLGVIIVDHGSRVNTSNLMFEDFILRFKDEFSYPIVQAAHMELASPTIGDAFTACCQQEAKEIVVVPYFFMPGKHIQKDIPDLCEKASVDNGNIPFRISGPLGQHPLMKSILVDQIQSVVDA